MEQGESGAQSTNEREQQQDIEMALLAAEEGYFEVPRKVSLVMLAEQKGISDREASQRIRRGVETVIVESDIE